MESVPVHLAVLTIANDAASADHATARVIVELATSAGHKILDEAIACDEQGAIRDQLVRWIAEPDIDVVIVAASVDSEAASDALAPLVVQTLPGFTDLFRWLTFHEIGASAMLSAAEAAQCQSTFVFVLPAHEAAVRAAMDKLILPQLDVRTKPKNLVTQMPRLKAAAKRIASDTSQPVSAPLVTPAVAHAPQAVPVPIVSEKTATGAGVAQKLPARSKTRTANTIPRRQDDPPTKEIDLAKLEQQIQLSNANETQTKEIELGKHDAKTKVVDMSAHQAKTRVVDSHALPRVPPGADASELDDDTDSLTLTPPARSPRPRTPVQPATPRSPAAIGIGKPPVSDKMATPPAPLPTAKAPATTTPIQPSPPARVRPPTPPPAGAAVAPSPLAVAARTRQPTPPPPPVVKRSAEPLPSSTRRAPTESPPSSTRRAPTTPPPPASASAGAAASIGHAGAVAATAASGDDRPVATAASPGASAAKRPAPNAAELWAKSIASAGGEPARVAEPASTSDLTDRSAAGSASDAAEDGAPASPVAALFAQPARKPKPTPPPPAHLDPLANLASKPIGGGELPQGDFVYPIKRSSAGLVVKIIAGLAVAAAGFFAFVELYPSDRPAQTAAASSSTERAAAAPPPSRSGAEPPPAAEAPPGPAVEPSPEPSAAAPAPPAGDPAAGSAPAGSPTAPATSSPASPSSSAPPTSVSPATAAAKPVKPTSTAVKPTTATTKPSFAAATPAPVTPSEDASKAKPEPEATPSSDPSCDEVACVMSKYDRPCCERYRPTDTFTPKNVVPEELDRAMVKAGVETIKPKVVACGEKAGVKGTVKLAVSVDPEGTVKTVSVTESPDSALGECVAAAMRNAKFAKSVKGSEFVYPFVF